MLPTFLFFFRYSSQGCAISVITVTFREHLSFLSLLMAPHSLNTHTYVCHIFTPHNKQIHSCTHAYGYTHTYTHTHTCRFAVYVTHSCLTLCDPHLWTVARQAPLPMKFSRQEYWSELPFPPPGDLSNLGIEPTSPVSPTLQADSFPTEPSGNTHTHTHTSMNIQNQSQEMRNPQPRTTNKTARTEDITKGMKSRVVTCFSDKNKAKPDSTEACHSRQHRDCHFQISVTQCGHVSTAWLSLSLKESEVDVRKRG